MVGGGAPAKRLDQLVGEDLACVRECLREELVDHVARAVGAYADVVVRTEDRLELVELLGRKFDDVVEEARDPIPERLDRDEQRPQMHEVGAHCKCRIERVRIKHQCLKRPPGPSAAQEVATRVEVSIDEARHDEAPAAVDDLSSSCVEVGAYGGDRVALDQDIRPEGSRPVYLVDGDDRRVVDQSRHLPPP